MHIVNGLITIILSVFSTAIMSYIAMATPIGPWMAPTLVFILMLLYRFIPSKNSDQSISLIASAASLGGIIATACAFSFPTLYFLEPDIFNAWMAQPWYFAGIITALSFVASTFGLWIGYMFEDALIVRDELPFPIGQMVHNMVMARHELRKAYELLIGFFGTIVFCVMQDGVMGFVGFIPKQLMLFPGAAYTVFGIADVIKLPAARLDIWPMLWAIGFIAGHVIALPLAVGALTKIGIVHPLHQAFFPALTSMEFILAFCSGMILVGAFLGFARSFKVMSRVISFLYTAQSGKKKEFSWSSGMMDAPILAASAIVPAVVFLSYFGFPWFVQLYLLFFTFICTYQIGTIAGKMGLAPLGQFATFVMVPAMLLFPISSVHIVFIATFVEVSCGVAAVVLFGHKSARMGGISRRLMTGYQYLGLVASCATVGMIFWLFINHFQLGSSELLAYKAQARQLLINVKQFDGCVLFLGALFGFILKHFKINPTFVLGGILMPLNISLGLVLGGVGTLLTKQREKWEPLWSGVFASNALWMFIKTLL